MTPRIDPSDSTRLWHPYTDQAAVLGRTVSIARAEGVWLWDDAGRRLLDATSSLWYAAIGHGRKRMADAIAAQVRQLDAYSIFNDLTNEPAERLATRIAELAPVDDARVFLGTGGSDGIETAAKLARLSWAVRGMPQRTHLISRANGFHGSFGFGTSIAGIEVNRTDFGPLAGATSLVPHDSLEALEAEILRVGPERVAAFFCEPVIGAGGVLAPPEGYLEGVADLCREHGILLIADEVICAFGRLGTWFGSERFGIRPDMIVFAKGVTSGYLPLGGVVVSGELAEPLWRDSHGRAFRNGATYAGHPTCCVAALENLDIIEEEGLLERSRMLEGQLAEALAPLGDHPLVTEIRAGTGLMAAVELDPAFTRRPGAVVELYRAIRDRGVLVRPLFTCLAMSPPLVAEREHLSLVAAAIGDALDAQASAPVTS